MDPPAVLIMRRKSIRQFANNQRVALYYVDKINKYVTVPYEASLWGTAGPEGTEYSGEVIEEGIIQQLTEVVNTGINTELKFNDGSTISINTEHARDILKLHESLTDENREKLKELASRDRNSFREVLTLARNSK